MQNPSQTLEHLVRVGCLIAMLTPHLGAQVADKTDVAATPQSAPGKGRPEWNLQPGTVVQQDEVGQDLFFGVDISAPATGPSPSGPAEKGEWVVAPVPGYAPVLGATLAVGGARIYRPAGTTESAPSWITGAGAFGAQNGSWGLAIGHKMNLGEDRWRMSGGLAYADVQYRFYGIGNDEGDLDVYVPIRQKAPAGVVKILHEIAPNWYFGVKALMADSTLTLNPEDLPPEIELPPEWEDVDESLDILLAGLVPILEFDSRDNEFFPKSGILLSAQAALFSESLGSDFDFEVYSLAYNQYFAVGKKSVLGLRAYGRVARGDVPFFALSTLGKGSDIRGYTPGRYRDNALVAAQVEWRYEWSDSWSFVAFGGVGAVGPSLDEIPRGLPAGGFGVRYRLAKKSKLSLRFDAAWGRDDSAIYLSVGEAF